MKLRLNGDRIIGIGVGGPGPEYDWDYPKDVAGHGIFIDKFGHTLYRWDGDKAILNPQVATPEEIEAVRQRKVEQEIKDILPKIMRTLANDPGKGFDDLKAAIKAIDDSITTEAMRR